MPDLAHLEDVGPGLAVDGLQHNGVRGGGGAGDKGVVVRQVAHTPNPVRMHTCHHLHTHKQSVLGQSLEDGEGRGGEGRGGEGRGGERRGGKEGGIEGRNLQQTTLKAISWVGLSVNEDG